MLDCLLAVCLTAFGGLGYQPNPEYTNYLEYIGRFGITAHDIQSSVYMTASHLSGINTPEGDLGLNTLTLGVGGLLDEHLAVYIGGGAQVYTPAERYSNELGSVVLEAGIQYTFDNLMYVKAHMYGGEAGSYVGIVTVGFQSNLIGNWR